jgi:penicillin amidase/acyl-homoserine-lactone acylase
LPDGLIPPEGKYDVKILRDEYGVPHIYGKTDAAVAYALAFANCEDDWATMEQGLLLSRGRISEVEGKEMAPFDYLVHAFDFQRIVDEKYETDLAPATRALVEAYADGCNHYAALHPEKVKLPDVLPATGKDIIMGFVAKAPLFFGLDNEVKRVMDPERRRDVAEKQTVAWEGNILTRGLPIGSNTFAVAPSRTPDGSTHLAINSHQPFTGPVAWYEARLHSEEGYDMVGGVFPGTPVILHGHNRNLGWAHTVNSPDLVDIYELEINPENPNQYKFDGEWRDLEVREVAFKVRIAGPIKWTVKREALKSVHGPAIRTDDGKVYAVRYAGYGDIRQVEQWYQMGRAQNMAEFEEAMKIRGMPSFNVGYGDKEGNIWYIYNALSPIRAEGYDWEKYLPGNTSETLWTEYLPFEKLPMVKNPASGFIQNCNGTPYQTTTGDENPKPEDFSETLGIETDLKNRGYRALELLGADDSISLEDFYTYKYDLEYSRQSEAAKLGQKILDEVDPAGDPLLEEALEVLRNWDLRTNQENTGTAIAILTMEPVVRSQMFGQEVPDVIALFKEKAKLLKDTFGKIDVEWGKVNRLVRGDVNLPLDGGPDVLRAVYGEWDAAEGHLVGVAGDCYVLLVSWDKDGNLSSTESIHQFGSATLDETSPHYADQAKLFAEEKMKPTWLDEAELRQHLQAEYRPGEAWDRS